MKLYLTITFTIIFSLSCLSQTPELNISTKNKSEYELKMAERVQQLASQYDLSKWIFTKEIIIEDRAIPHSHPVLTLNTRRQSDDSVLSTLVHEQTHWYMEDHHDDVQNAIKVFNQKYPEVPFGNSEGARDEFSTYLHLLVCYIEYKSMIDLVGEERAKIVMEEMNHYTWIYDKVLNDTDYIGSVVESNGLNFIHEN